MILLFFMVCPLAVFATISLTKSPLFAFAFVWWFGVWYGLHMTHIKALPTINGKPMKLRKRSLAALFMSSCVMLIGAKYAWYIILFAALLAIINDRKRWKTYVVALMLPTVLIHGGLVYLVNSGAVIGGDPIESRGIQLQQIARVAKYNPQGIPRTRPETRSVFNLDQMAESYFQQDADPVKSSGIQSKKVSYKWRTVTKDDMKDFNDAWWQIVKANPQIALDALFAECFGYFNVTDLPYVSMDYYVNNDYVQSDNEWIHLYNHQWRNQVAGFAKKWGQIPVLGWVTHGNLYVTLTLLIGAAEVVLRRWRSLSWHLPLLLLMGVMIAHRPTISNGICFRSHSCSDSCAWSSGASRVPRGLPHARRRTLARRRRANGVSAGTESTDSSPTSRTPTNDISMDDSLMDDSSTDRRRNHDDHIGFRIDHATHLRRGRPGDRAGLSGLHQHVRRRIGAQRRAVRLDQTRWPRWLRWTRLDRP